jgi:hypothetical protein
MRDGCSRETVLLIVTLVLVVVAGGCRKSGTTAKSTYTGSWAQVPDILAQLGEPNIPDRDFDITKFEAVADGTTDCRPAIMAAIQACEDAGGGRVNVPAGTYLVNGPIYLASDMNLHLAEGAHLKFGTKYDDYLPLVLTRWEGTRIYNYCPFIYAYRKKNVALTGTGTLDGQAKDTWSTWTEKDDKGIETARRLNVEDKPVVDRFLGDGYFLRPSMITFFGCENVLVDGVQIVDSPFWCLHPTFSKKVTIRNVRLDSHNPDNDGIDVDSCEYVHIHDVTFDSGDDGIAIKSGLGPEALDLGRPSRNVYIHDCTFNGGTAIAVGGELSGSVYNIFAENCRATGRVKRAFCIQGTPARGGEVAHIRFREMTFLDATNEMIDFASDGGGTPDDVPLDLPPYYHDVRFQDMVAKGPCSIAMNITGESEMPVRHVVLSDVTIRDAEKATNVANVKDLATRNVMLAGELQEPNATNLPPDVYAGPDVQLGEQGGAVTLNGAVTDDGKPAGKLTYVWSVIQGDPAGVSIANPAALKTQATLSQPGVYILKLEASDGESTGYHFLMVKVGEQPDGMEGVSKPIFSAGE